MTKRISLATATRTTSVDDFIRDKLSDGNHDDNALIVVNLSEIQERFEMWKREFPKVEPFFALKAQHNPVTVQLLARNGCGFDVASLEEIRSVEEAGVSQDMILYAQPYKQPSHLRYALQRSLLSVCDTVDELLKVGELSSALGLPARILLRILPDDKEGDTQASLSSKFGASISSLDALVAEAARWPLLSIVGVSFHVGSHCHDAAPYLATLKLSRVWWDRLEAGTGGKLSVLDIGGGYPGEAGEDFRVMAGKINRGLENVYGDIRKDIRVIAEPGRYMVTSSVSVVAQVIAEKDRQGDGMQQFVLNTGVYGGLSHSIWDKRQARGSKPYKLIFHANQGHHNCGNGVNGNHDDSDDMNSDPGNNKVIFWGPTCDSTDRLVDGYKVTSQIRRGDWMVFPDLGAYCSTIMTVFNGFQHPETLFVFTNQHAEKITEMISS